MGEKKTVSALVSGGEANAGPPLGPAMGPMGVKVLQVVNTINEKTKDFQVQATNLIAIARIKDKQGKQPEAKRYTLRALEKAKTVARKILRKL